LRSEWELFLQEVEEMEGRTAGNRHVTDHRQLAANASNGQPMGARAQHPERIDDLTRAVAAFSPAGL